MHRKFWAQLTRVTINSMECGDVCNNDQQRVLGELRSMSKTTSYDKWLISEVTRPSKGPIDQEVLLPNQSS